MVHNNLSHILMALKSPLPFEDVKAFQLARQQAVDELREHGWLTDGTLRGRDLRGLSFTGMDLSGADLRDTTLNHTDFVHANLSNATLTGANLRSCSLYGATLCGVDFTHTDLEHANLTNADLRDSMFAGTRLRYAVFNNVYLGNTTFRDVALDTVIHLHLVRWNGVPGWLDENTLLASPNLPHEFLQAMGWEDAEIAAFKGTFAWG